MSSVRLVPAVLAVLAVCGCSANVKDAKTLINLMPASQPQMVGTYDFDLLDPVVGEACVSKDDTTYYSVAIEGVKLGSGFGLQAQAESAALFDAISKSGDADSLLVTRSFSQGDPTAKVCTRVWGRAVRLKKGPTPGGPADPGVPPPPAVAPASTPATPEAPAQPGPAAVQPTRSQILEAIQSNEVVLEALKSCVSKQKALDPKSSGSFVVRFMVSPEGGTTNVRVVTPGYSNKPIAACVVAAAGSFRFSLGGSILDPVDIDLPIKF